MSAEAVQLRLRHVVLLLADYQQLAASYYAHMMLSRWVIGLDMRRHSNACTCPLTNVFCCAYA